jgi:uncharacterized protein (TIGR00369 family)
MNASAVAHAGGVDTASTAGRGAEQSRLITWRDPMATQTTAASMPGLSYWRAVDDGRITFSCVPDESMYNTLGIVHGGAVWTLLDTVTGCALHTTLPQGVGYTSIEIKVNYLKAVTLTSGPLTAVGNVVKAGSRIGFTDGQVIDASGKLVVTATSTLLILELPSPAQHSSTNGQHS